MRAYQWLQYFDEHTKDRVKGRNGYRLLFLDGHESHKKYDFINYCQQNRIIPYCFPSKLTHRLQPLDSKPFQAYKHYYRRENNRTKRWGGSGTEKKDFLRRIHMVRMQTFTPSTVRHAFKHCGLWPFNSEVICQELRLDDGPDLVVYDGGKEYELPEWDFDHSRPVEEGSIEGEENLQYASIPGTPPASSSTINSPPKTIEKLQKNITKARESFPSNDNPSKGGALRVRDSNTLIRNRDIVEAEQQRRKYEREAKKLGAEMLRRAELRDQENQRRDAELEWVTGDDSQPLYTSDSRGGVL